VHVLAAPAPVLVEVLVKMKLPRIFPSKIGRRLLHYRAEGEFQGLRLHLRVEDDGSSILIINASRILFLNRTATEHVYLFMQGKNEEEAAKEIRKKFKVDKETALQDYRDILFVVNTFAKTPDVCPVSYLGVEKVEPFQKELSAPYRMDLALTYRCDNKCIHCYAGGPRETVELTTSEWFRVMDKLHSIGIPHVVFTGGEPTLRDDLVDLIAYTQKLELVSGLVTNGRRLRDATYLNRLVEVGLDHIQITVESHDEQVHDKITGVQGSWRETVQGLKNAIATPIYTLSNTTLNQFNVKDIIKTIDFLYDLGLTQFACNSVIYSGKAPRIAKEFALEEADLEPVINEIKNHALARGMDFTWYTPTQYCVFSPLQLELGIKNCSACRISMCIEPNGVVIPCQSYFTPLGKILTDDWEKIWNNPLCQELRSRAYAPEKCQDCPQLSTCGAGCPLQLQQDGYICDNVSS
jgi:radical SAM protein with 4Fe4S-binding SPASM domain